MQKSKLKSLTVILVILVLAAAFALISIYGLSIGSFRFPAAFEDGGIVLGLDLVGGSYIVFEANAPEDISAGELSRGMDAVVTSLNERLKVLGYTEAIVARSGERRVRIEIPNINDPEAAVQMLGSTAQLLFLDADGNILLTGEDVKAAAAQYGPIDDFGTAQHYVLVQFTEAGKQKFTAATEAAISKQNIAAKKNYIVISLDGDVKASPFVSEAINSESCIITGGYDETGAKWLAGVIQSGQLPFDLLQIQMSSVGPTLGEQSLSTGLIAGLVGIILVMIFMIAVYRLMGVMACVSLALYTGLVAVILNIFSINLSLPGIAGIVLSIGMAVDANIIIFERVKEELRLDKTIRGSVRSGFKKAFRAIFDSNITTMIAAVVLILFAQGTIVGFAYTLLIGVAASMMTALFITRLLLMSLVALDVRSPRAYGI